MAAFKEYFIVHYEKNRAEFFGLIFETHTSNERVRSTLADTLLGVKGSRLIIVSTLDDLCTKGFLPLPTPKAASTPSSLPPPSPITPEPPRRRSMGEPTSGGLQDEDECATPSLEQVGVMRSVEDLWRKIGAQGPQVKRKRKHTIRLLPSSLPRVIDRALFLSLMFAVKEFKACLILYVYVVLVGQLSS